MSIQLCAQLNDKFSKQMILVFSCIRLWKGETVGPLGLGLGTAESRMFEVLYRALSHTCRTTSHFYRHGVWIWQSQALQLSTGHILQGKHSHKSRFHNDSWLLKAADIHVCFSLCALVGKDEQGSISSSYLLCGQPQPPGDEEQYWEVQTDGGSNWRGLPGQRVWEWETLGEEGSMQLN